MSPNWDQAFYELMYSDYSRAGLIADGFLDYIKQLNGLGRIGINNSSRALFVGCGLGFLIEVAIDSAPGGWDNAWGTDISSYIQSLKQTDARADIRDKILNINILDSDATQQLKAAGVSNTGKVNWVITDLVSDFSDVNLPAFFDACENIKAGGQGGILHIVYPLIPDIVHDFGDGRIVTLPTDQTLAETHLNLKLVDDWVALRPDHYWMDMGALITNQEVRLWVPGGGWQ